MLSMSDMSGRFAEIVGNANLLTGDAIPADYSHDEALSTTPQKPAYVAKPATAEEVAQLLKTASEHGVPVDGPRIRERLVRCSAAAGGRVADLF